MTQSLLFIEQTFIEILLSLDTIGALGTLQDQIRYDPNFNQPTKDSPNKNIEDTVVVHAQVGKEFLNMRQNEREIKVIRVGDADKNKYYT